MMDYECEFCEDDGCDYCPDGITPEEYMRRLNEEGQVEKGE
tara:strand:- start:119 stop:241 length:123 start_codon:yes stop_codon:yes gene_type:complete